MIEENDNYKVMFYFLSPNVLLLYKIASWNVFFLLRNSVLCIWLSNEGIKHKFHLSLNYYNFYFFGKQMGFTIKIKTWNKCRVIIKKIQFKKINVHNFSSSSMYIVYNSNLFLLQCLQN